MHSHTQQHRASVTSGSVSLACARTAATRAHADIVTRHTIRQRPVDDHTPAGPAAAVADGNNLVTAVRLSGTY